jgi:hypothetical protein
MTQNKKQQNFWLFLRHYAGCKATVVATLYLIWLCGLKMQPTKNGSLFEMAVSLPDRDRIEKAEAGDGSLAQAYFAPIKESYNYGNILDKDAYKDVINELDYRVPRAYAGLVISFFAAMRAWKKTKQASAQLEENSKSK